MSLWTHTEAEAATGGSATAPFAVTGLSIDTRSLRPGDLFVALKAARDGHDFVAQAFAAGAAAALVDHVPEGVTGPCLVVPEVLAALTALGAAGRARAKGKVIAVTGSVGKTSTKEMLREMFDAFGSVHAAEASFNNHWGVPITLARLPAETDFAVIEIGMNHPGEIAPLARMARLDVAMVTTVAPAHLEAFDSVEGIAEEKASIFDGLVPGGTAIFNADIATTPTLRAKAEAVGARAIGFGASDAADWRLIEARIVDEATVCRASHKGTDFLFKVSTPGRHFALNALGALAVAEALGADPMIAAHDLGRWAPPAGRGQRERIVLDIVEETFFDLIDDAFNANPASMAAALDVLIAAKPVDGIGRVGDGRRIAILGDMLELGPTEADLHAAIARQPGLSAVHVIHCVGPRMQALHAALPRQQRGDWVESAAELVPRAPHLIDAGDVVLVKGSKGSKVSLVVDALRRMGQRAAPTEGTV